MFVYYVFTPLAETIMEARTELMVFLVALCFHWALSGTHRIRAPPGKKQLLFKQSRAGACADVYKGKSTSCHGAWCDEHPVTDKVREIESSKLCENNATAGCQGSATTKNGSAYAFAVSIKEYGHSKDIAGAWRVWEQMRSQNSAPSNITIGCMVEALVTSGDVNGAHAFITTHLDEAERKQVTAITYGSLLKGYTRAKQLDKVFAVFHEMVANGIQPRCSTYNVVLDACARCAEMRRAPQVLQMMDKDGIEGDVITFSTIIKGYCNERCVENALALMDDMKSKKNMHPDEYTYNIVIRGCAQEGRYEQGMAIFEEMCDAGVPPTNFTLTVLVKLASRCHRVQNAFKMCEEIPEKYNFKLNVHVYNGLIQACIFDKNVSKALAVMKLMVRENVHPDSRTYMLLVQACISQRDSHHAASLLCAAYGVNDAHEVFGARSKSSLQIHGGLPPATIRETLEAIRTQCHDHTLATQLAYDLGLVARA